MNIKFLNEEEVKQAKIVIIAENIIQLQGVEQNLSGFHILTSNGDVLGKYEDYTTLYRVLDDGYQLSNNKSVYIESEPIAPIEKTLKEIQEEKIKEMEFEQQSSIHKGVEVELSDGTKERFSLEVNDQLSLNVLNIKNIENTTSNLPWHPADENVHCKFYSENDIKVITDTYANFVMYHVTYFRDLRIYIRSLKDKETIKTIKYGVEIPTEYRSEVLSTFSNKKDIFNK